MSERIDQDSVELRRRRLTRIFADIVEHAQAQSLTRCPYRDRRDLCTARFGCRNQGPVDGENGLAVCQCDGQLDYRSAWEVEDPDLVLAAWREGARQDDLPEPEDVARPGAVCGRVVAGETLFDVADRHEARVDSSCGRVGSCHECVVEVLSGQDLLETHTPEERFIQDGFRLACQARAVEGGDVTFAALRRSPIVLIARVESDVVPHPAVCRQGDTVVRDGEVVDRWRGRMLGLAVDVGTTTVAAELLDLESGQALCRGGFENPQRFGGSDVISRIAYDDKHPGEMHQAIRQALNNEILSLCQRADVSRHQLYEILVVGNATMRDLVFGINVQSIGQRPYKSMVEHEWLAGERSSTALDESARRLGIAASPYGRVVSPPLLASHLGSDVAAGLLACDFDRRQERRVFLDIGTNTEVVMAMEGRVMAASCPAGPAFEGGLVQFGLPACEGAIDSISAIGDGFEFTTVSDGDPVGLCGSGLIDLLAELRRTGQMSPMGVYEAEGGRAKELVVVDQPRITLSRADGSHLAQAKAASFCGQYILLRLLGADASDIERVDLAGGFASSIDVASAIEIGFLAGYEPSRVQRIGNAALEGARQLLLDTRRRERLDQFLETIEHVELETTDDFFEIFTEGCQFKPMN